MRKALSFRHSQLRFQSQTAGQQLASTVGNVKDLLSSVDVGDAEDAKGARDYNVSIDISQSSESKTSKIENKQDNKSK